MSEDESSGEEKQGVGIQVDIIDEDQTNYLFDQEEQIKQEEEQKEEEGEDEEQISMNRLIEEKKILSSQSYPAILHIGSPHFILIVGSTEKKRGTIQTFDSKTNDFISYIKQHKTGVKDIIRWGKNAFMTCDHSYIHSFSCHPPFPLLATFHSVSYNYILRILELSYTDDLFLFRDGKQIVFVNYDRMEVVKKYDYIGPFSFWNGTKFLKSKNFRSCFYANTNDEKETVKLIDFQRDLVIREFTREDNKKHIITYSLFHNSKNIEILICFVNARTIFFFDTTSKMFETRIEIKDIVKSNRYVNYQRDNDKINCSHIIGNQYLVGGDRSGIIHLYEIIDQPQEQQTSILGHNTKSIISLRKILKKELHGRYTFAIKIYSLSSDCIKIISSCQGTDVKVSKVSGNGIRLYRMQILQQWKDDQTERIRFLMDCKEKFLLVEDERNLCIGLKIFGAVQNFEGIFKVFFV